MVSIVILYYFIILWDHFRICSPSLTKTSLCGAYLQSSLPHLIKYAVTQIKEWQCKSNNVFIYLYWLYNPCMEVTTDAPQFTRCLFTALRTTVSELQQSGCNSCSANFVTSKCLCNNCWKAFHTVFCFPVSRSSWLIKTSVLKSARQQRVFTRGSTDWKWKNLIHASVFEQKRQNDRKQYPIHY